MPLRSTVMRRIEADEIFVSDGAKCDSGNIQEIFALDNRIAVCDPVYPVYVDTNVMAGRTGTYDPASERWSDVIYMPCTAENNFAPELPKEVPDLIYLCFPTTPTGFDCASLFLQECWIYRCPPRIYGDSEGVKSRRRVLTCFVGKTPWYQI